MGRKSSAGKSAAVDNSGSGTLEGGIGSGASHEKAGAGQAAGPNGSGTPARHVPGWAYALVGLGLAAIFYVTGAGAGYFPNPLARGQEQTRPIPTVTTRSSDATEANKQRQEKLMLEAAISSELSRLRSFENYRQLGSELAQVIETTLGKDGYDSRELSIIRNASQVAGVAETGSHPAVIEDLKAIFQTQSYRSTTINVGDRSLELIVLASDPARAPFYFDILQRIIPKVEAFTGLKYPEPVLVIHSQPQNDLGAAYELGSGLTLGYPQGTGGAATVVVRRYETTTEGKAIEEYSAHEFDHKLTKTSDMPVWLAEGKADFTSYHTLRSGNGLPVMEAPFAGYHANLELNVRNTFGGKIPPISEYDGTYPELAKRQIHPNTVTGLGELLLQDIMIMVGPQNMSLIVKDINAQSRQRFIDKQAFYGILLAHTPKELQPDMTAFLQERYEGVQSPSAK